MNAFFSTPASVTVRARRKFVLRPKHASVVACMLATIVLTGCVSGNPIPPRDLSSFLTPTNAEAQNTSVAEKTQPETDQTGAPAVQNSLAPSSENPTPSEQAVQEIAATEPVSSEADVGVPKIRPGTKIVSAKPSAADQSNSTETAPDTPTVPQEPEKKKAKSSSGFFASLFNSSRPKKNVASATPSNRAKTKRKVRSSAGSLRGSNGDLPGVRTKGLFGVDIDEDAELDEPLRLASVSNLARRGSHGLLIQRPDVRVDCFPPELVRLLKKVERRFGRTPIVTSGYRSKAHNRRIRGARNSTHTHCMAADIQVKGISKWQVAKYLRSLPGRGGVGTYCHTRSVHIDIGKKRDWNRRCRRKRRRA